MSAQKIRAEFKKHRASDWFALFVFASVAIVFASVLSSKIEEFKRDMDTDARISHAQILQVKILRERGFIGE